jgi:hypothetical protein
MKRVSEKIQMMSRVLGNEFSFDVTHQSECGSIQGKKCDCNFVVTISKQSRDTRVSGFGVGLTPSPVPCLPSVRGDGQDKRME